jgi:hypothetical protein
MLRRLFLRAGAVLAVVSAPTIAWLCRGRLGWGADRSDRGSVDPTAGPSYFLSSTSASSCSQLRALCSPGSAAPHAAICERKTPRTREPANL